VTLLSDMNSSSLNSQSKTAPLGKSILVSLAVVGLTFSAVSLRSQTNMNSAKPSNSSMKETAGMKTFVLIFRQPNHQPLTDAEKHSLAKEMGPWARHQIETGHKLDPHILGPESMRRGSELSADQSGTWPITALLFLEAHDLSEATQIAESHPGLRYGANVEVRPWSPPVPIAPAAKTPAAL
jgi:hypothetical protein